jgi:hypothetical protein
MKKWLFIIFLSTTIVHSQERSFTIRLDDEKINDNKLYFDSLTLMVLPVSKTLNKLSKKLGATIIDLKDIESSELRLESLKYSDFKDVDTFLIYQKGLYRKEPADTFNIRQVRRLNRWFSSYANYIEGFEENRQYSPDFIQRFKMDTSSLNNETRYVIDSNSFSQFSNNEGVYVEFSELEKTTIKINKNQNKKLVPFLLKNTSVTNGEYKEFVKWVQDSIVREILWSYVDELNYEDYELDSFLKREMLNLNDELYKNGVLIDKQMEAEPTIDINNELLREVFNLNWDFEFRYDDRWVVPLLDKHLYLPTAQRFYRARQVDVRKLKYKFSNQSKTINIYPDTLGFVRLKSSKDQGQALTNMYFWHPAYDNHPVVNISHKQMMAYLHWKEMMLNQAYAKKGVRFKLELPKMEEIELAMIQMKNGTLAHQFKAPQSFIKQCDSTELLSKLEWPPISRVYPKSKEVQFLGWNISEYSQTYPGKITAEMTNSKWSPSAKVIYGTNWINRKRIFQDGFCTDALETTDVVSNENFSRPYLGFRYTIRIIEE